MRAKEFLKEDGANDLEQLAAACENWVEMAFTTRDIQYILSHPFSAQFKTVKVRSLYRVVFTDYEAYQKTGTATVKPQDSGFLAYSSRPTWGSNARSDFDYSGDMIRFKKKVIPADILLDFSALLSALYKANLPVSKLDESEIWVKATPYYTTFNAKEFVDAELADGTVVQSSPKKIRPADIAQFKRWVGTFGVDPENAARQLNIPPEMIQDLLK